MTVYIVQGRFTEQAIKGMIAKPEDRAAEVTKLAASVGARMVDYYVTFGESDFLVVLEGDDNIAAMSAMFAAASGGGVTNLRTTVGVRSSDAVAAMKGAGAAAKAFRAAGA